MMNPNLKRWLGNSVTVENGKPMVFYHGTGAVFSKFKAGSTGAIFFAQDAEGSNKFSVGSLKRGSENPNTMPVHLKVMKPYRLGETKDERLVNEWFEYYFSNEGNYLTKSQQKSILKDKFSKFDYHSLFIFGTLKEQPKKLLEKYGYDAIVVPNTSNSFNWGVFEPSQVKSIFNKQFSDSDEISEKISLKKIMKSITESKQVGTVYHATSLNSAIEIVNKNILFSQYATKNIKGKTISTTRDKNFLLHRNAGGAKISGQGVILALDGTAISSKYKTMPYDDRYDVEIGDYDENDFKDFGDEMEQVWFGKKLDLDGGIKNIKNYIKYIVILKSTIELLNDHPTFFKRKNQYPLSDPIFKDKVSLTRVLHFFKKHNIPIKLEQ